MTGAASTLAEAPKLFTQCPKCETVFKLSAEVLRAAGGQVRCGKCGDVFNALARLAEDAATFEAGESALDLETRANSILETVVPPQVAQAMAKDSEEFTPPGVEIARLEILDWSEEEDDPAHQETDVADTGLREAVLESADRSMEFTLPPGELDRIFVESKKRTPTLVPPGAPAPASPLPTPAPTSVVPPAPPPGPSSLPPSVPAPAESPLISPAPPPAASSLPPRPSSPGASPVPTSASPSPVPQDHAFLFEPEAGPPPHPESAVEHALPSRNRISGFEVPDDVRRDMLEGFEHRLVTMDATPDALRRRLKHRPLILWLSAAILSALLLMIQVVHQNREWFTSQTHGPFGAMVRALYGALGAPLPQPANLSAFELRQWGVTGDPDANGTLRLRASILNTAAQLQPYPLLRVTLADRFGKGIGRRDFEPSEYLGKPTAKLLAPGERVDATLAILDPGKSAEGFEIDVCLRGVDQRITCANDVAPQSKR